MSWGFFLDFTLAVPTTEWKRFQTLTPEGLSTEWWGFKDPDLEHTFGSEEWDEVPFSRALKAIENHEGHKTITETGGTTSVRVVVMLDYSGEPQMAKCYATVLEAALKVGGEGYALLVNDGAYAGEAGVRVSIDGEELVRERLKEFDSEELAALAFGKATPATKAPAKKPPAKAKKAARVKKAAKVSKKPVAKKPKKPPRKR
jgi:hypothetical protein